MLHHLKPKSLNLPELSTVGVVKYFRREIVVQRPVAAAYS
jgi:hypothetical protein